MDKDEFINIFEKLAIKNLLIYLFFIVFILCSCSEEETSKYKKFTEKKAQAATERTIRSLTIADSLNITKTFYRGSFSHMGVSETSIVAKLGEQIVILNKQDLRTHLVFRIRPGRGPGEVINFDDTKLEVVKERIAVFDENAKKIALYDLNGNFQEEFLVDGFPIAAMAMADEQTYYFKVRPFLNTLFYEVTRTINNSSAISRKFQKQTENRNILAYTGWIVHHDQSLYFAGFSEPLIRRYDLSGREVELVFSRGVIDSYNRENNYKAPKSTAEVRFWGFTEEAQFASKDVAADDNYLYSIRHHNDKEGYKYLDLYSADDGSYAVSFALQYYPEEVVADEHYIYTLESKKTGETVYKYLMKYEKPEIDFKAEE